MATLFVYGGRASHAGALCSIIHDEGALDQAYHKTWSLIRGLIATQRRA